MTTKTMTAKYRGRCRCGAAVRAGDTIDYAGKARGVVGCPSCSAAGPDDYSNINPVTGNRMSNRARVVVTTFASGDSVTVNSRGRCEDAPCCGCCS